MENTHTRILVDALCIIGIIFAVFLWKNQNNTTTTQQTVPTNSLALKQQCSTDGVAYFNNTLLPQTSPVVIAQNNLKLFQQFGQQEMEQSATKSISFPMTAEYAYSAKLNTCLIYYVETTVLNNGGAITDFNVADVYKNKIIDSYFEVDGKPGNQGSSFDNFNADKRALMGD